MSNTIQLRVQPSIYQVEGDAAILCAPADLVRIEKFLTDYDKILAVVDAAKDMKHETGCVGILSDCTCGYYDLYEALKELEE